MKGRRYKVLLCIVLVIALAVSLVLFFRWKKQRDAWDELERSFVPGGEVEIHTKPSDDSNSETDEPSGGMSLASFYWEEDAAEYQNGDANVNPNAFVNTDLQPINDQIEAEERAKNEVTIEYNATSHYRDTEAGMWRIDFHTLNWTDDGIPIISNRQKVYLDDNGITHLIVYED